jgi:hypothetical protein
MLHYGQQEVTRDRAKYSAIALIIGRADSGMESGGQEIILDNVPQAAFTMRIPDEG